MSLVPCCTICDTRLRGDDRGETRCARCRLPCPTCNGDVAHCQHPLRPDAEQLTETQSNPIAVPDLDIAA